ncbi:MAG: hypothetical protein LUG88_07010 [Clostridia bacterium]|nr:hypothetical protein [Clostridia bacterium]
MEAYERETIINWSDADPEADIQCYRGRLKTRLDKLAEEYPNECHKVDEHKDGSAYYVIPKSWVKINPPRRYTAEQQAEMTARLRKNTETRN